MKNTEMLKKNYEFKKILLRGKYFSGEQIEALIIKNNKNKNFLGIAVSTKIGKAVTRNKVKRLIRESYKILEQSLIKGNSIIFLWKKENDAKQANFDKILNDMNSIFNKAKIIEKEENI